MNPLLGRYSPNPAGAITDVPGVRVGHATEPEARTGVTVILFDQGAMGAGLLLGPSASTRGFESLHPRGMAKKVHGVCLAGGSTFGLGATSGVLRYLVEHSRGLRFDDLVIPLVPAAIIFDLHVGIRGAFPTEEHGYRACVDARDTVEEGSVGAGTGALVGKILRWRNAMAGGVGTASRRMGEATIGALAVVNAFGDVRDPATGRILAGARKQPDSLELLDMARAASDGLVPDSPLTNTTLVVIVTDAALDPMQCGMVAQMASAGFAHAVSPVFCPYDGDVVIVLSTGDKKLPVFTAGQLAADLAAEAIVRGVLTARAVDGIPCAADLLAPSADRPDDT
jgi:L-aminopeptidase/D-esterase-like protein